MLIKWVNNLFYARPGPGVNEFAPSVSVQRARGVAPHLSCYSEERSDEESTILAHAEPSSGQIRRFLTAFGMTFVAFGVPFVENRLTHGD